MRLRVLGPVLVETQTGPVATGMRIRTDISTIRRVLRTVTGNGEAMVVVYGAETSRYINGALRYLTEAPAVPAAPTPDDEE